MTKYKIFLEPCDEFPDGAFWWSDIFLENGQFESQEEFESMDYNESLDELMRAERMFPMNDYNIVEVEDDDAEG